MVLNCCRTFLRGNIWLELEPEPELKYGEKGEPEQFSAPQHCFYSRSRIRLPDLKKLTAGAELKKPKTLLRILSCFQILRNLCYELSASFNRYRIFAMSSQLVSTNAVDLLRVLRYF